MPQALQTAFHAFIALLVVLDPPALAILFLAITPGNSLQERRTQARRGMAVAALVLLAFALGGGAVLRAVGIDLPAMKIAGGLLLFLFAANMVLGNAAHRASPAEWEAAAGKPDVSVFPLAVPLVAGPGAMTTVVLMREEAGDDPWRVFGVLLALLAALGLTLAMLLMAGRVGRLLGPTGGQVIGRVLGVILAALATQIVLDGLHAALP